MHKSTVIGPKSWINKIIYHELVTIVMALGTFWRDMTDLTPTGLCAVQRSPDLPISQDQGHFLGITRSGFRWLPAKRIDNFTNCWFMAVQNVTCFMSLISEVCCLGMFRDDYIVHLSYSHNHSPRVSHLCIVGCRRAKKSCAAFQETPLPLGQSVSPWSSFPRKGRHLRFQLQLSHIDHPRSQFATEKCCMLKTALQVLMCWLL